MPDLPLSLMSEQALEHWLRMAEAIASSGSPSEAMTRTIDAMRTEKSCRSLAPPEDVHESPEEAEALNPAPILKVASK